jgi:hypothetical protein
MVKNEGPLYCKEKIKPALFVDDMVAYIEKFQGIFKITMTSK